MKFLFFTMIMMIRLYWKHCWYILTWNKEKGHIFYTCTLCTVLCTVCTLCTVLCDWTLETCLLRNVHFHGLSDVVSDDSDDDDSCNPRNVLNILVVLFFILIYILYFLPVEFKIQPWCHSSLLSKELSWTLYLWC